MAQSSYDVRVVLIAPRKVAGVRATVHRGRVAQEFRRYLDQVYAAGRAGAVGLDGQNIFIYRGSALVSGSDPHGQCDVGGEESRRCRASRESRAPHRSVPIVESRARAPSPS